MKDLYDAGLRGHLPLLIQNFLSDRSFRVRVGNTYSNVYSQEMFVPQGSILSVTLFSIKINSIVKRLPFGMQCSLYVRWEDAKRAYLKFIDNEIITRHIIRNPFTLGYTYSYTLLYTKTHRIYTKLQIVT